MQFKTELLSLQLETLTVQIRSLRFSDDGRFLAMAEPADFVHIYDAASGYAKCQEIDLFGEIAGCAFSPDAGTFFVSISDATYSSLLQFERSGCRSPAEWLA